MQLNQLRHIINPPAGMQRPEFNIEFVKKSTGEIISGLCLCLNSNFKTDTIKIKFIASEQIRTIHALSILSYNNEEINP
jgi:hypothetical protein